MDTVILVIHMILALAIILLVLLQRSEGGGLGIGGGGGGAGGFATAGQTANALTKATAYCAAGFFMTSLLLAILAGGHSGASDILRELENPSANVAATLESAEEAAAEVSAPVETTTPIPDAPIAE